MHRRERRTRTGGVRPAARWLPWLASLVLIALASEPARSQCTSDEQAELFAAAARPADFYSPVATHGPWALLGSSRARTVSVFLQDLQGRWTEQAQLAPTGGDAQDAFGYALALSDREAFVGAPSSNGGRGTVFVFARDDGQWVHRQTLSPTRPMDGDRFGFSLALDHERLAVGAPGRADVLGAVHLYVRDQDGWSYEQSLGSEGGAPLDGFGRSIALRGPHLVAGTTQAHAHGAALAFQHGRIGWTETQRLLASDGAPGDDFGSAVALGIDRLLIGAPLRQSARGAVYAYSFDQGRWHETERLAGADVEAHDQFGASIAIAADLAAIGSWQDDVGTGAAYTFRWRDGRWLAVQKLRSATGRAGDQSGVRIAASETTVIVGTDGRNRFRGGAFVFDPPAFALGSDRDHIPLHEEVELCVCGGVPEGQVATWVLAIDGAMNAHRLLLDQLDADGALARSFRPTDPSLIGSTFTLGAYSFDDAGEVIASNLWMLVIDP